MAEQGKESPGRRTVSGNLEQDIILLSSLLDNATDSIFLHDFEGRFLYANKATWQNRGYTREEFMALRLSQLDTPEFAGLIPARMEEIQKNGAAIFEAAHSRKDGSILPVEVHSQIVEMEGKKYFLESFLSFGS